MHRAGHLAALALVSAAVCGHARLVFDPPVLLGIDQSSGIQASVQFSELEFAAAVRYTPGVNSTVVLSRDGGLTYTPITFGAGFGLPEWPMVRAGGGVFHDFGNVSHVEPKTTRPTYFNFTADRVNTLTYANGTLRWQQTVAPVYFAKPSGARVSHFS